MGDYRSRSYADGRNMQVERYNTFRPQTTPHDFRSYSTSSYASASAYPPPQSPPHQMVVAKDFKLKKIRTSKLRLSSSKSWGFSDPEFQRRKRVASYKVYSVEGKVKGTLRKSFRWLRNRYTKMLYGWS